jgi:serine/threonine-protein kinase HipA
MAELHLWMNGLKVGRWGLTRTGQHFLRYDDSWVASPQARALSISLPITPGTPEIRGDKVERYFDNLLPDTPAIRQRIRGRFRTRSTDAFDLLTAIGRDCVGAVQLLPPDMEPVGWDRIESRPLSEADVERVLTSITSIAPPGLRTEDEIANENFRISIAGAQEKTALLRLGTSWHVALGATPTTHILKLPLGIVGGMRNLDMRHSVENEWLCSQILRELGIDVAHTEIATFGSRKVLVVERFDRRWQKISVDDTRVADFRPPKGSWIVRLPQEDFCQATGTAYDRKYEADGGPGIQTCLDLLATSAQALLDRRTFVKAQLAFWMLCATDGHAKNFSIFHRPQGVFRLTPLYDVVSAWPVIGHGKNKLSFEDAKLAMALRGRRKHYRIKEIVPRHFKLMTERSGDLQMYSELIALAEAVPSALARIEQNLTPAFPPQVWTTIADGIAGQARSFAEFA